MKGSSTTWNRHNPAFEQAAIEVLRLSKRPLTIREITDEMISKNLITVRGKTPAKTLYAIIKRKEDLRAKRGEAPVFHKIMKGSAVRFTLYKSK